MRHTLRRYSLGSVDQQIRAVRGSASSLTHLTNFHFAKDLNQPPLEYFTLTPPISPHTHCLAIATIRRFEPTVMPLH